MLLTNQKNINYETYMKLERKPPLSNFRMQKYNEYAQKCHKKKV